MNCVPSLLRSKKHIAYNGWLRQYTKNTRNANSWFSPTWWDSHVHIQNKGEMSLEFCIIIESNSQRLFSLLLCTPTWPPWRHMKTENSRDFNSPSPPVPPQLPTFQEELLESLLESYTKMNLAQGFVSYAQKFRNFKVKYAAFLTIL